jgi:sulfonate transport system substrate-binding protein
MSCAEALRGSTARRGLPLLFLLTSITLSACGRDTDAGARRLALVEALPTSFPRETELSIGDPTIRLQLAITGQLDDLPFTVEWHNISGGPHTLEAFRGQALDGGSVGDTPPIHAELTGLDIKIVAVQTRSRPSQQLAIAPGAGIKQLPDLRGKRIAYSPGQAQGALVLRVLRKLGLQTSDVELVELSGPEFKDALLSRQVDAAPLGGVGLRRYLNAAGKAGAIALDHGVRDGLSFFYVRTAVLDDPNKAAALREYVKLRTRAQLWSRDHPEQWIAEYYVKDQSLSLDDARYVVDSLGDLNFPADWNEAIALTQETIDLIARASGKPRFDAAKLFDRRFEHIAAEVARQYASNTKLVRTL